MSSFTAPTTEQIMPAIKGRRSRRSRLSDPNPLDSLLPVLADQNAVNNGFNPSPTDNVTTKKRGRKPRGSEDPMNDESMAAASSTRGLLRPKKRIQKKGRKPKKLSRMPKIRFLVGGQDIQPQDAASQNTRSKKKGRAIKAPPPDDMQADEMMHGVDLSMKVKMENAMSMDGLGMGKSDSLKFEDLAMKLPTESLMDLFQNENLRDMFPMDNPLSLEMMANHDIPSDLSLDEQAQVLTPVELMELGDVDDFQDTDYKRKSTRPRRSQGTSGQRRSLESSRTQRPSKKPEQGDLQAVRRSPRQTKTKVFVDHVTF